MEKEKRREINLNLLKLGQKQIEKAVKILGDIKILEEEEELFGDFMEIFSQLESLEDELSQFLDYYKN